MRLICPNCDAQYEVPDDVIPDTGRDVQCSDCGHTWFQSPASQVDAASEEFERQPIPSEVSEILQEEAEFEMQARAQDQAGVDEEAFEPEFEDAPEPDWDADPEPELEEVPEPVLDNNPFAVDPDPDEPEETDAERRAREARARMERMRGVEANNPFTAASDSRNSVLPDVDALNSSLSPDTEAERRRNAIDLDDLNRKKRRGAGFRNGFAIAVFVGLIGMAIYISHGNIGRALPFTAEPLAAYADWVDGLRFWVEDQAALRLGQLQMLVDDILNG